MNKKDTKKAAELPSSRVRPPALDEDPMGRWHTLFERENPSGHESFQEWLGLPEERVAPSCSITAESKK